MYLLMIIYILFPMLFMLLYRFVFPSGIIFLLPERLIWIFLVVQVCWWWIPWVEEDGFCFYCFSRNSRSLPASCGHSIWCTTACGLRLWLCRGEGSQETSGALSLFLHSHHSPPPRSHRGRLCLVVSTTLLMNTWRRVMAKSSQVSGKSLCVWGSQSGLASWHVTCVVTHSPRHRRGLCLV